MRSARRIKTPEEVDLIRAAATVADAMMTAALDAVVAGGPVKAVAMEAMAAQGVTTAAFEPRVDRDGHRVSVAIGVLRDGWEADLTRSTPDAPNEAIADCRAGTSVADLNGDVHGVGPGYEVLSPSDTLEPGMVLSVGVDSARDTVFVTDGGPEILTTRM
jgi:Xaa-Pro aminopeptidase